MRAAVGASVSTWIAAAAPAGAAITGNTFESDGTLGAAGRSLAVGVVLGCDTPGTFAVEVTVRQGDAEATGVRRGSCTGDTETLTVRLTTREGPVLQPGAAEACAVAATRQRGVTDDTRSWCRPGGIGLQASGR